MLQNNSEVLAMLKLLWKWETSQSKDLKIWLLLRPLANLLLTASGMEMILENCPMGALWWVKEENAPEMPMAKNDDSCHLNWIFTSKITVVCNY